VAVSGLAIPKVKSGDCAFKLGPRINAAGRLESAVLAYELLLAPSLELAQPLAAQLDSINQERQTLLSTQIAAAQQQLGAIDGLRILIVESEELHEGIVGLVASRLVDQYHRPAVVIKRGPSTSRGSARSIEGFHITEALDACSELFERHGGHARAAGFTLPNENLDAMRAALTAYAEAHIDEAMLCPRHTVDAVIPLEMVNDQTPAALASLGPFGEGNPQPALATLGLVLKVVQPIGREGQHLRLQVTDGKRVLTAVAFRQGSLASALHVGDQVDIIYRPDINEWQGNVDLQLVVEAIRPSRGA
jgi:single-stranded-DNA-specific exonuclease